MPVTINHLPTLLASMQPILLDGEWLFCSVTPQQRKGLDIEPILEFREAEGIALVLKRDDALRLGIDGQFLSKVIRLNVYSSLDAVGFLAAITTRLASHGVSVQPVSAFYHDHLFVPASRAEECIQILTTLAKEHEAEK